MSKPLQLACSKSQWDDLHADLDRVRSTSATVKVSKAALAALLKDHSHAIAALHTAGVHTQEND
jgi:hypothetical protein